MKILVLTKRQYMGKDLLDDRFGRFRELPLELARRGHEVKGLCLSYRRRDEGAFLDSDPRQTASVSWHSINLARGLVLKLGRYCSYAHRLATESRPDLIWACSDAYHAVYGNWLARRCRRPCVIDLYDNFEAFGASRAVLPLFRHAVRETDGVTCFSRRMADHVTQNYPRRKPTAVIESAVRKEFFYPQDRKLCRERLGLPENARIIGTAGALDGSRAIETLFRAFELLVTKSDNLHLALAGPRSGCLQIPTGPQVHDLGTLPYEEVPSFINSLDLSVICYRQSPQGKYSFPQKAYEIMACRVPLIAAAVGSMNEVLSNYPQCLYEPENPASLADAVLRQLDARTVVDADIPSWADSAKQLEQFFDKIVRRTPTDEPVGKSAS